MISTVALCIILFSGGIYTKITDIRPVLGRGITLATLGVLLMTVFTGVAVWLIADKTPTGERVPSIGIVSALLLAATMSSTDSASVFSILRSKGLNLKHSLKPTIELESGSNDPMAYVLTLTHIGIVLNHAGTNIFLALLTVLMQLVVGDNIDDIKRTASQLELQQAKAEEPKMITKVIADKIGQQIQQGDEIKTRRKKKK